MHAAGLLDSPLDSRGFMRWGDASTRGFRLRHPVGLPATPLLG